MLALFSILCLLVPQGLGSEKRDLGGASLQWALDHVEAGPVIYAADWRPLPSGSELWIRRPVTLIGARVADAPLAIYVQGWGPEPKVLLVDCHVYQSRRDTALWGWADPGRIQLEMIGCSIRVPNAERNDNWGAAIGGNLTMRHSSIQTHPTEGKVYAGGRLLAIHSFIDSGIFGAGEIRAWRSYLGWYETASPYPVYLPWLDELHPSPKVK